MRAPAFWMDKSLFSTVLLPLAALYSVVARARFALAKPVKVTVPVICVGNLVAGGAGKTPVALALGSLISKRMDGVFFLLRGYGGKLSGPVCVDPLQHCAADVGDEALLLADLLPTMVSRNRVRGAKAAIAQGARLIIMDDGFQNPALFKDISLVVVDGTTGFGNGRLLPAGPLREKVKDGLSRARAVILMNEDIRSIAAHIPSSLPLLYARLKTGSSASDLVNKKVIGFAGIGRPEKFYATLKQLGCDIVEMVGFPDHFAYQRQVLEKLSARAQEKQALLVTTAKDFVRLPPAFRERITVVQVEVEFSDEAALMNLLSPYITR